MIQFDTTTQTGEVTCGPLTLTSGEVLSKFTLRYEWAGSTDKPLVLVCHALTGNHLTVGTEAAPGWWSGLIGKGKYINTEDYQVLTFNVLGGCDGSTGPLSINPETNKPYRTAFPNLTVSDMVNAQYLALTKLGITELETVVGGSLGGMQVMEWGLLYPALVKKLIILAATPVFSDYGIAFNHIAASAIKYDPHWSGGQYETGAFLNGLSIARMVGMVTYRSSDLFTERFQRRQTDSQYDITSYLDYQGEKLARRFDANSYLCLLQAMNGHHIGYGRGGWITAAKKITQPVLLMSFDKDLIYEPLAIREFAQQLPEATYHHIETNFGHDGFLTEFNKWGPIINEFLEGSFTK